MALFGSFASFNGAEAEYILSDGITKVHPQMYTAFASDYAAGKTQIENDYTYLAGLGVKMLRIWPIISQFYYYSGAWQSTPNSSIANFDSTLSAMAASGLQAYCTLMSTPQDGSTDQCSTNASMFLSPDIIQTPATQTAFLAALSNFITRYRNNTTIVAYDVCNEFSSIISKIQGGGQLCGTFGANYDTNTYSKLTSFASACSSTIKGIDTQHLITFSMAGAFQLTDPQVTVIKPSIDFYDAHVYTTDPTTYYQTVFPSNYDKPVIQGECGVLAAFAGCEADFWNVAPMHSDFCQQEWMDNSRIFIQQARAKGVQHMFFSYWPTSRWFGIRTDGGSNTYLGHQLTRAGQLVLSMANEQRGPLFS